MKIIEDGRAPNPRRVRIFLAEKNISVPFEQVDINEAEHKSTEFTKLNPMQRVPVLILDDGTALSESVAICRYFEELHPSPALMGAQPLEKAQIEMWNRRMEWNLLWPIAQAFRHTHPAMAKMEVPQVEEWGVANRDRALETMEILNQHLEGRTYIASEGFSIADITAVVALDFVKPARIEISQSLSHLQRWLEHVRGRESVGA